MNFVFRTIATAVALWVATKIVSGIHVEGEWYTYLIIAVVFGLVNGTVGTVVKFMSLPFVLLSLGLMLLVINAAMLGLTAALLESFSIENLGSALLGALIIALVGTPTSYMLKNAVGR